MLRYDTYEFICVHQRLLCLCFPSYLDALRTRVLAIAFAFPLQSMTKQVAPPQQRQVHHPVGRQDERKSSKSSVQHTNETEQGQGGGDRSEGYHQNMTWIHRIMPKSTTSSAGKDAGTKRGRCCPRQYQINRMHVLPP